MGVARVVLSMTMTTMMIILALVPGLAFAQSTAQTQATWLRLDRNDPPSYGDSVGTGSSTSTWTDSTTTSTARIAPGSRLGAASGLDALKSRLYVFGGEGTFQLQQGAVVVLVVVLTSFLSLSSPTPPYTPLLQKKDPSTKAVYSDLWCFSMEDKRWAWLAGPSTPSAVATTTTMTTPMTTTSSTTDQPGSRTGAVAFYDETTRSFWLFGGLVTVLAPGGSPTRKGTFCLLSLSLSLCVCV